MINTLNNPFNNFFIFSFKYKQNEKLLLILLALFLTEITYSQSNVKEYSKDIALYQTKFFISKEIIGEEQDYQKFIIDPLAAAKSSELTSAYYEIVSSKKKGLILGFYDKYWMPGATYQGFSFKNLNYENAIALLDKIENIIKEEKKFLNADDDENNIYFTFQDMVVIIYRRGILSGRIRIEWNNFDAEWENTAFRRTKRRFEKAVSD